MITAKLVIANWKMNGDIRTLDNHFTDYLNTPATNQANVVFALPHIYLSYIKTKFTQSTQCQLAAQDVSMFATHGAFTGEVSASMLSDCGVKFALVGHSERRTLFNETAKTLHDKLTNLIRADITPVFCIGESSEYRNNGRYIEFVTQQLALLKDIGGGYKELIVAYEPIWAIGTGVVPSLEQITEMAEYIKNYLAKQLNVTTLVKILYGGSVNAQNAASILALNNIGGLLVGGASLKVDEFSKICAIAQDSKSNSRC